MRGTRFILSIRRKSAFICEATVKAILAEGVYMRLKGEENLCTMGASVGGGKKNWKGAKESIVAPPPPFVHRTKALNSTMHPSKRTIANSLSR